LLACGGAAASFAATIVAMSGTPNDATFSTKVTSHFRRSDVADLATADLAAIQISPLLGEDDCKALLDWLNKAPFDTYNPKRVSPVVDKFGPSVNDHYYDGELLQAYWDAADSSRGFWASASLVNPPAAVCRAGFLADWPESIAVARRRGTEMHCGIVREINRGLQVHFDDASREFEGDLLDSRIVSQFAFNLYLSGPDDGGETIIWRRRWQPGDEEFRIPNSYGYHREVVADAQAVELQPRTGTALLFDSRHYHTVRPVKAGRRISLACFVGLTHTGDLVVWS
jgi:hypothetical protein